MAFQGGLPIINGSLRRDFMPAIRALEARPGEWAIIATGEHASKAGDLRKAFPLHEFASRKPDGATPLEPHRDIWGRHNP
jgi:hypothetical protein